MRLQVASRQYTASPLRVSSSQMGTISQRVSERRTEAALVEIIAQISE